MDELTRDFIATSKRLSYLTHCHEHEQTTHAKATNSGTKINEPTPSAVTRKQKTQMKNAKGHKTETETETEIEDYLERLKEKFDTVKHDPKFILETLGFIVLAVYAGYTIAMYYATRDSANAAKSALIESNRSWIEIRMEDRWYKRGNYQPSDVKAILSDLKDLAFLLTLKNIGRSPVKDIRIEGNVEVPDADTPVSYKSFHYENMHPKAGISILYPDRSTDFDDLAIKSNDVPQAMEIGDIERQEFLNGDKYIIVYARGTFHDSFGKHWVEFCMPLIFSVGHGYKYGDCINYNDAGDGDPPWTEAWP
jgi:hypothetical protein